MDPSLFNNTLSCVNRPNGWKIELLDEVPSLVAVVRRIDPHIHQYPYFISNSETVWFPRESASNYPKKYK